MNIMAINPNIGGTVSFISNGEMIYYGHEDRYTKMKHDGNPFKAMLQILMNYSVDKLIICGFDSNIPNLPVTNENPYTCLVRKFNPDVKTEIITDRHHFFHASTAFYSSGFKTAAAVIVSSTGSIREKIINKDTNEKISGIEAESIFSCSYPDLITPVWKKYCTPGLLEFDNGVEVYSHSVPISSSYYSIVNYLDFFQLDFEKVMLLSGFGNEDEKIPDLFISGKSNNNLFKISPYGACTFDDNERYPYLIKNVSGQEWHYNESLCEQKYKNLAYKIQKETQELVCNLIQKAHDDTGETNIVISGDYALNYISNAYYKKRFPKFKIYIDPLSHSGGTSLGAAFYYSYKDSQSNKVNKLHSLSLSSPQSYQEIDSLIENIPELDIKDINIDDIVELLQNGELISVFDGASEAGQKSLGNRSIIFDATNENAKSEANKLKSREWFRSFPISILEEHCNKWFEDKTISEFMTYNMKIKNDKIELLNNIKHKGDTCLVQTVSSTNLNFYNLLIKFCDKTNLPLLANTSFNLPGNPFVETLVDAFEVMIQSKLKYMYFPEINKLVYTV